MRIWIRINSGFINGHMNAGYSWQIRGDRESLEYFWFFLNIGVGEMKDLRIDKLKIPLFFNKTVWDFKTTISLVELSATVHEFSGGKGD